MDNELYNKINQLKQKIPKFNNFAEAKTLQNCLSFDKDNGITIKEFYPLTRCEMLIKELNIERLTIDDGPEKSLNQISNNSRYYIDKIIKLITNLDYTNFIIYTYKFNIIICKLYFLNYINIPQFNHLNDDFYNDGTDESLIKFATNYCSFVKRKFITQFKNGQINKNEFISKMNIDTSSKYYCTTSKVIYPSGFHQHEWGKIGKLIEIMFRYRIHEPLSNDIDSFNERAIKLKNIFITIVRDIFNLPFDVYNKSLIDNFDEVNSLTNGIYINSQIGGHYNNFIKHNEYYIMFDDIIYKPTKTTNEHNDVLYKNIQIKNLDGKLYTNSIVSNNKISTPFVLETSDLSKYLIILLGRHIYINHDEGYKNGFNSFNFNTTNISKIHGSNKFSMLNIILIVALVIMFIVLIIIIIVIIIHNNKYHNG